MMEIVLPPGARAVLRGPDMVARTLAARERDPQRRWLLRRPRAVRRAFLEEVVEGGVHEERWMLLRDRETRESYVSEVLEAAKEPDRQAIWLLGQTEKVRRSYVERVIDGA
jgi:hypothetical protein